MKAKVTGVSAWQKVPVSATLDIEIPRRYVDSSGNATVRHYTGVLNDAKNGFKNPFDDKELWIVVQGPDDPPGVMATFYEVVDYGDGHVVRTTFSRRLVSSDLQGLYFDYAAPEPGLPLGFGDAPLSMRAAADVVAMKPALDQALADNAQRQLEMQAATEQATNAAEALGLGGLVYLGTTTDGFVQLGSLHPETQITSEQQTFDWIGDFTVPVIEVSA